MKTKPNKYLNNRFWRKRIIIANLKFDLIKKIYEKKYFIFQRYFFLYLKRKTKKFKRQFKLFSGYTWEQLLNAVTVASLFLLLLKIFVSLISFKFSIFQHFFCFMVFSIISLYYNFYKTVNWFLINFLEKMLYPPFYEPFVVEYTDELDVGEEFKEPPKTFLNVFFEYLVKSFVFFRLVFLLEPFLFNFCKFIILYWFLYDYNLTLAYLFSFLFIFSRFIFFLTDTNFNEFMLPLKKSNCLKNDTQGIFPNVKNTNIITFWILRVLNTKGIHEYLRNTAKLPLYDSLYIQYLSLKVNKKLIVPVIELQNRHVYTKIFFFISIFSYFISWLTYSSFYNSLMPSSGTVAIIKRGITPSKIYPISNSSNLQHSISKLKNRHRVLETEQTLSDGSFLITQNAFTSQPIYVTGEPQKIFYNHFVVQPEIQHVKIDGSLNVQAVSRIGHSQTLTKAEFTLYKQRSVVNPSSLVLTQDQLQFIEKELEKENNILDYNVFQYLSPQEIAFYYEIHNMVNNNKFIIDQEIIGSVWALLQSNYYKPYEREILFEKALEWFSLFPVDEALTNLYKLGLDCKGHYNTYIPPYDAVYTKNDFSTVFSKINKRIKDTRAWLKTREQSVINLYNEDTCNVNSQASNASSNNSTLANFSDKE